MPQLTLAAACPQLTSLNLSFCNNITDAAVAAVAAGMRKGCARAVLSSGICQATTMRGENGTALGRDHE